MGRGACERSRVVRSGGLTKSSVLTGSSGCVLLVMALGS